MARKKAEPVTVAPEETSTEQPNAAETNPPVATEKSEGPCAAVRRIMAEQRAIDPEATRKTIIDACVIAGVNLHTAKTQYQKWHKVK